MPKTSIHISPVKAGSEIHNRREKDLSYVRGDLTHLNQMWKSDDFPSINRHLAWIRDDYKEAHGQKMQEKMTPVREAVVVISEDTTMSQLKAASDACRRKWGLETMQIYMHLDEGHQDHESGEWIPNRHAHVVFNWYDRDSHTTFKLNKYDMMAMQDIFAESLGMERGISSDKKHLNAIQYKNEQEALKLQDLRLKVEETAKAMEKVERTVQEDAQTFKDLIKDVQKTGLQLVDNFNYYDKNTQGIIRDEDRRQNENVKEVCREKIDKDQDVGVLRKVCVYVLRTVSDFWDKLRKIAKEAASQIEKQLKRERKKVEELKREKWRIEPLGMKMNRKEHEAYLTQIDGLKKEKKGLEETLLQSTRKYEAELSQGRLYQSDLIKMNDEVEEKYGKARKAIVSLCEILLKMPKDVVEKLEEKGVDQIAGERLWQTIKNENSYRINRQPVRNRRSQEMTMQITKTKGPHL